MLSTAELTQLYTTEQTLVILLTRLYFGTQPAAGVQEFITRHEIDWPGFYRLLTVNHIRGLLYEVITTERLSIDTDTLARLKKHAMEIAFRGMYQLRLNKQLQAEFKQLGIPVIPYKGATLAARYFRSPLSRESSDIDFLVAESSVMPLRSYFHRQNYGRKFDAADEHLPFIIKNYKELSFKSPKDKMGVNCSVEIQWRLLEHYFGHFPAYHFFAPHLQTYTDLQGNEHVGLSPTYDFLCIASHHLIKEPLWRFKYLFDLACMIRSGKAEIDWTVINQTFKSYGYTNFLNSGLTALQDIIGITVAGQPFKKAPYHLFMAGQSSVSVQQSYLQRFKAVNAHHSFLKKIQFSIRAHLSLLTPNLEDLETMKLPPFAIPLLTLIKPFRLMMGQKKARQ